MSRPIPPQALRIICEFEGLSLVAYWDAYGRVWTIGWGETQGVYQGMIVTREWADNDLRMRLAHQYAPSIDALGVPLTDNQYSALLSFVWNLGPGSMSWDVGRLVRARNYAAAANALLEYDRAGGVQLAGLTRRRHEERALFLTPDPPPPPPPNPYLVFADEKWGKIPDTERRTVQLIDGALKQPVKYHGWLLVLYGRAKAYRDRVKTVARQKGSGGWAVYHRGERWQGMNKRMLAIKKAT